MYLWNTNNAKYIEGVEMQDSSATEYIDGSSFIIIKIHDVIYDIE